MNKEFERYLILVLLLILIGLGACVKKPTPQVIEKPATEKEIPTITDTIGKMESIGAALGCMFAPQTCGPKAGEIKND
tara:strand:+ start:451 stop:684 length:234 start_codon:yes stop_codon:yes gene_type:complete